MQELQKRNSINTQEIFARSVRAHIWFLFVFLATSEVWESFDLMTKRGRSPDDRDTRSERINPPKHQTDLPVAVVEYQKLSLRMGGGLEIPYAKWSLRWIVVRTITQSEFAFKAVCWNLARRLFWSFIFSICWLFASLYCGTCLRGFVRYGSERSSSLDIWNDINFPHRISLTMWTISTNKWTRQILGKARYAARKQLTFRTAHHSNESSDAPAPEHSFQRSFCEAKVLKTCKNVEVKWW